MLGRFVRIESSSDDPAGVARMGRAAVAALTDGARGSLRRAQVSWVSGPEDADPPRGPHALVRIPGAGPESGKRPVLLLGHLDTVWPSGTLGELPWRVEGRTARGPGVFDMKAGLVQTVWALRALDRLGRAPRRPVRLIWNSDEEVGSGTSRGLIEGEARKAFAALVMEPSLPDGGVKTRRKGVGLMRVRVRGRAAHAGLEPERGINAITELSGVLLEAAALAAPEEGTTVSAGLVRGGSATNVVPAEAEAWLDLRVMDPVRGERLLARLRALRPRHPEARIRWSGGMNRGPLTRSEGVIGLYRIAREIAAGLDWDLGEGSAGGASDGNLVAAVGTPVLDGLGPGGDGAHARREHVQLDDLPRRAALLARLVETL